MKNFEKWKDEILKIKHEDYEVAVKDGVPKPCVGICNQCEFEGGSPCIANFVDWLLAEYQEPAPKLTKREREFLECFNIMESKEIRRNCCGLFASYSFEENNKRSFAINGKMFPFIKPGESWKFEDLLKLEVEE